MNTLTLELPEICTDTFAQALLGPHGDILRAWLERQRRNTQMVIHELLLQSQGLEPDTSCLMAQVYVNGEVVPIHSTRIKMQ